MILRMSDLRERFWRLGDVDTALLLWTMLLMGIGFTFVYSSSALLAHRSALYGFESAYFIKKQVLAAVIGGAAAFFIATSVTPRQIEQYSGWILGVSIVFLVLVFVPGLGSRIANVNRWIRIAGFSFQPAELAKLALVLYLAKFIADRESRWISGKAILKILCVSGLMAILIYKEPDYSTAVFIMTLTLIMLFLGGLSWSYIGSLFAGILGLAAYGLSTKSYILTRIQAFLSPWDDPGSKGFQILQSYIALVRGGISGVGLGNSVQKTVLLPEPHTDFIFAVIGEEAGFVGTAVVAALFLAFLVYGLRLAARLPSLFLTLASSGIVLMISIQALLNMAVVTGLLPVTGEPLPLISAGGTHLVVTLTAIGCLLCFSKEATS